MSYIPFQSYYNQLYRKIRSKNIQIDPSREIDYIIRLKNHSYYALINGYKPFFLRPNESDSMIDNTEFDHFFALKVLEMDISSILLKYLLIIEQGLRTRIGYIIAREYGTDDTLYLSEKHFIKGSLRNRNTILNEMKKIRDTPYPNSYSLYFKNVKSVSIPPWILLQDMKYHDVIGLYSILKEQFRNEIRNEYIRLDPINRAENRQFFDTLNFLREYRNIFAHSKRNFKEKINYSTHYEITKQCSYWDFTNKSHFDQDLKSKSLYHCMLLILSFLNDEFLVIRFIDDLALIFLKDGYINDDFSANYIFNGKSVYDILELPQDFFIRLYTERP